METTTLFYHDDPHCTAIFFTLPEFPGCPACRKKTLRDWEWQTFQVVVPPYTSTAEPRTPNG